MDVFPGWTDHASRLEKNWRERVSDDDTVVIPGDISWAMSLPGALSDFKFIDSLPGKKIISKGNHDYWWSTMAKAEKFFDDNDIKSISILHNNFYPYEDIGICGTRGWINDGSEPRDKKVILREAQRLERSIQCALGNRRAVQAIRIAYWNCKTNLRKIWRYPLYPSTRFYIFSVSTYLPGLPRRTAQNSPRNRF